MFPSLTKWAVRVVLTATTALAIGAVPANAQAVSEVRYSQSGPWSVQSFWLNGNLEFCSGVQPAGSRQLRIAYDGVDWALMIQARQGVEIGIVSVDRYSEQVAFEPIYPGWSASGIGFEGVSMLRSGARLIIGLQGEQLNASLSGSNAAMTAMQNCMVQNSGRSLASAVAAPAPAPAPAQAPQRPVAPAQTAQPSQPPAQRQVSPQPPLQTAQPAVPRQVGPATNTQQPSAPQPASPQPVITQPGAAPQPVVSGNSRCSAGAQFLPGVDMCSDEAARLISSSQDDVFTGPNCVVTVGETPFPHPTAERYLVFHAVMCNGQVAQIEAGLGARMGSLEVVQDVSGMGWAGLSFGSFADFGGVAPAQRIFNLASQAAPAVASGCQLYRASDLGRDHLPEETYLYTQYFGLGDPMDAGIMVHTYGGECGPLASFDSSTEYWRVIGDHVFFFTFGQDAFDVLAPASITMVEMQNGQAVVVN